MSKRAAVINSVERIIDANINRAKEGLRVCEEVTRFILEDRILTSLLKKVRHEIDKATISLPSKLSLLKMRSSNTDIGINIYANELKRNNIAEVFTANIQRVKESLRVLEEFSKLNHLKSTIGLKKIRYEVYEIEKKVTLRISSLYNSRQ